MLRPHLKHPEWQNDPAFEKKVDLMRTRAQTILEIEDLLMPFYDKDFVYDPAALTKMKKGCSFTRIA